jgi:hypothetical protein
VVDWTRAPEKLDETVVDVLAEWDDAVYGLGPDDEGAFVALKTGELLNWRKRKDLR